MSALLILLSVVARAGVFPEEPFSSRAAGTTSANFLKLPNGARAQALGGAVSAGAEGADAVFWNPAGLARMTPDERSELALSYGMLLEETYAGSGSFARPTGSGAWGAAFTYFGQSAQEAYTAQGDRAGEFKPYDLAVSGSYAHRFLDQLALGGTLKVVRSVIDDVSGNTAAVDLGLQARHVTMIGDGPADFGLSLVNLGPELNGAALPFAARFGMLWHASKTFHPAIDLNFPVDEDPFVSIGLEARFPLSRDEQNARWAALRAGFNQSQQREKEGLVGLTAGGGVDLGRVRLDYAWAPYGDLGMTNRVTVAVRF